MDALGNCIGFGYSKNNTVQTWLKNGNGNLLQFGYDSNDNFTTLTYPNGSEESITYSPEGLPDSLIDRSGKATQVEYNTKGLISRRTYSGGRIVDYTYDTANNLLTLVDSVAGMISMQYDERNQLQRINYPGGRWLSFTYDNAGRRICRTSSDGFILKYQYDLLGHLIALKDGQDREFIRYEYNIVGRITKEIRANGTYTTYERDGAGRVTQITHLASDNHVLSQYAYTYDAYNRPLTITTLEGTTSYTYDAHGQLTKVALPGGRTITYSYDANGNRITVTDTGVTTAYSSNELDQYDQVGSASYRYDDNGNLVAKTNGVDRWSYTYDENNRLVQTTTPKDVLNYEYDALGQRSAVVHNGQRVEYLVDPIGNGDIATMYDAGGSIVNYVCGERLVCASVNNEIDFYHFDGVGNTAQITDPTGQVINAYQYLPFGECTTLQEGVLNAFTYCGQDGVMQDSANLYSMRARMYDPTIGRFLTPDPIRITSDLNMYRYGFNNPLAYSDPSGLNGKSRNIRYVVTINDRKGGKSKYEIGPFLEDNEDGNRSDPMPDYTRTQIDVQILGSQECGGELNGEQGSLNGMDPFIIRALQSGNGINTFDYPNYPPASIPYGQTSTTSTLMLRTSTRGGTGESGSYDGEDLSEKGSGKGGRGGGSGSGGGTTSATSMDPNEIIGPTGYGPNHAISASQPIPYIIYFENKSTATAPAEVVTVTDQLDPNLDISTLQLGEVVIGSLVVSDPKGLPGGVWTVPIKDSPYQVQIMATASEAGKITWLFITIDPATGQLPADPMAGFLLPNDDTHRGDAHVSFTIKPKAGVTPGTMIPNTAEIVFDNNPVISTNTYTNVIGIEQPDALIWLPGDAANSGSGEFGTGDAIPVDQVKMQAAGSKQTVVYNLEAHNVGSLPCTVHVTGPCSGGGWTVTYYDALTDGTDITDAVTTTGWDIPNLAPQAVKEFRVEITPDQTVDAGTAKAVVVTMAAADDPSKADAVKVSVTRGTYQPDLLIRASGETQSLGDGIYSATGNDETKWFQATQGMTATYLIAVQNDGLTNDAVTLTGTPGGVGWTVRYFDAASGGNDITDGMTGNTGWVLTNLSTDSPKIIRAEVTAGPSAAGQQILSVTATSTGDPTKTDAVKAVTSPPAFSAVSLVVSPSGHCAVGTTVQLTATATGGKSMVYKFMNGTNTLRDYAADPVYDWSTVATGFYTLKVIAKDLDGADPTQEIVSVDTPYTVTVALSMVSLASSVASPRLTNSPITLAATANGGANLVYKFLVNGQMVRDYTAENTYPWSPTTAGTYTLKVLAKDLDGADPTKEYASPEITYTITASVTAVSLAAAPASRCAINTPVSLTATATGGANLVYAFLVNGQVKRAYAAQSNYTWTPTTAGNYTLQVKVKDLNGADPTKEVASTASTYTVTGLLSKVKVSANLASPRRTNTTITLMATATGGANLVYKFLINGETVRDYTAEKSYPWKPTADGTYTVSVKAKDLNSANPTQEVTSTILTYQVVAPVTLTATPESPKPVNTKITLTANAVGMKNPRYRFRVGCQDRWGRWMWTALTSYGTAKTVTWRPTAANTYTITVWVRESTSIQTYDTSQSLTYVVTTR